MNIANYRQSFTPEDLTVMGVKFELKHCSEGCKRNLTFPDKGHEQHDWYEETLITDEVLFPKVDNHGKDYVQKVFLPIRFYNFQWAYLQALKEGAKGLAAYQRAVVIARDKCIDFDGSPIKLPNNLGFSSYTKFNQSVIDQLQAIS